VKKKVMNKDIFYSLTIEDIQTVAQESVGRTLTEEEIKRVVPIVEKRIPWFDILDDSITDALRVSFRLL